MIVCIVCVIVIVCVRNCKCVCVIVCVPGGHVCDVCAEAERGQLLIKQCGVGGVWQQMEAHCEACGSSRVMRLAAQTCSVQLHRAHSRLGCGSFTHSAPYVASEASSYAAR